MINKIKECKENILTIILLHRMKQPPVLQDIMSKWEQTQQSKMTDNKWRSAVTVDKRAVMTCVAGVEVTD